MATIFAEGRQADVPVMVGSTAEEGTSLYEFIVPPFGEGAAGFEAYAQAVLPEAGDAVATHYPSGTDDEARTSAEKLLADLLFTAPMRIWARAMANVESDAYLYWFTWAPPIEESERYGAFHGAEIGYVFGNLDLFGAVPTDEDRAFSDLMASVWTQFARTGNPNGEGLPSGPPTRGENEAYMELGVDTGPKSHIRVEEVALISGAWAERRRPGAAIPPRNRGAHTFGPLRHHLRVHWARICSQVNSRARRPRSAGMRRNPVLSGGTRPDRSARLPSPTRPGSPGSTAEPRVWSGPVTGFRSAGALEDAQDVDIRLDVYLAFLTPEAAEIVAQDTRGHRGDP